MKVTLNKFGKVEFTVEEQDFYDAVCVEEMMQGKVVCRKCGTDIDSKGWLVLQGYLDAMRELIIEDGKNGTKTRAKRDLSDLKFAKIDGLDIAVGLPARIVAQAKLLKDALSKKKDVEHESRTDDEW